MVLHIFNFRNVQQTVYNSYLEIKKEVETRCVEIKFEEVDVIAQKRT